MEKTQEYRRRADWSR